MKMSVVGPGCCQINSWEGKTTSNDFNIRIPSTQPLLGLYCGGGDMRIGANEVGVEWGNGVDSGWVNLSRPLTLQNHFSNLMFFLVAVLCRRRYAAPFHLFLWHRPRLLSLAVALTTSLRPIKWPGPSFLFLFFFLGKKKFGHPCFEASEDKKKNITNISCESRWSNITFFGCPTLAPAWHLNVRTKRRFAS